MYNVPQIISRSYDVYALIKESKHTKAYWRLNSYVHKNIYLFLNALRPNRKFSSSFTLFL